jgi:hypothetical protein
MTTGHIPSIVAAKLAGALYKCYGCGFATNEFDDLENIDDLYDRVSEGEIHPSAQCPKCGALIECPDALVPQYTIDDCVRIATDRGADSIAAMVEAVTAKLAGPRTVWVLHNTTRHGDEYKYVFSTEEKGRAYWLEQVRGDLTVLNRMREFAAYEADVKTESYCTIAGGEVYRFESYEVDEEQ